ncbi:MAG: translation initiation factor IF-2 [Nanoarchaeota archaeon]|nr:translation initiation factor IF-2 [Nanoarchaeota archaeon]
MTIRSPICAIEGHVDHGKTSILDKIRGTSVVAGEAGKITQAIGASIIPLKTVKKISGPLLEKLNLSFTIPGILFIDTPGHAAFSNLRKRGGALADVAVLVVDINEGFKPQTLEAIEILKSDKTPFVVAANKIDLVPGWTTKKGFMVQSMAEQTASVMENFEKKLYELVGKLHELGFASERFDRIEDFTKQIAIVPTSAETGEGIPELLMMIAGLAQKFLEKGLEFDLEGPARGTVLEVKEEKGLGATLDVIIYDGNLKVNDIIIIGGMDGPIVTKIRSLLEPAPLAEMRVKGKFKSVKQAFAATGVKISAPGLDEAVSGMPIRSCSKDEVDSVKEEIQKEIEEVMIETDKEGVIIRADSLGSLEALIVLLKEKGILIKSATVGQISRKDIAEAESNLEKDPLLGVVLGFNTDLLPDVADCAKSKGVKVLTNQVIYKLTEDLEKWISEKRKAIEAKELEHLVLPGKFRILPNHTFRQNNPAVVGVDVLGGKIKTGFPLMNAKGEKLTSVKAMQEEKENITTAEAGKQVAVSMEGVTVGRQIHEGDVMYVDIPEEDFKKLKKLKKYLGKGEIELLKEIASIKRDDNPVWGI